MDNLISEISKLIEKINESEQVDGLFRINVSSIYGLKQQLEYLKRAKKAIEYTESEIINFLNGE